MSMRYTSTFVALALAFATLSGHVVDLTTGQSMPGVTVQMQGPTTATATSDKTGHVAFKSLKPGDYTIQIQSNDVPAQQFKLTLKSGQTTVIDLKVCSTTLDYHCGTPGGGGGAL
jgi:predicted RNA methylase